MKLLYQHYEWVSALSPWAFGPVSVDSPKASNKWDSVIPRYSCGATRVRFWDPGGSRHGDRNHDRNPLNVQWKRRTGHQPIEWFKGFRKHLTMNSHQSSLGGCSWSTQFFLYCYPSWEAHSPCLWFQSLGQNAPSFVGYTCFLLMKNPS